MKWIGKAPEELELLNQDTEKVGKLNFWRNFRV